VKWIRDATGRLPERPHYAPEDLEWECASVVNTFLRRRTGAVLFPLSTDDLTVLLEEHAEDLDLFADLTAEGAGVEGVTEFQRTGKPRVRISSVLSESPAKAARLRTTLAHELGHVLFHAFLWSGSGLQGVRCLRDSIARPRGTDWLEWQAGYACGAILMPAAAVRATAEESPGLRSEPLFFRGAAASALVRRVQRAFDVSQQAALVRLLQLGLLTRDIPAALRHCAALPRTRRYPALTR
jgi:hypothetical protein